MTGLHTAPLPSNDMNALQPRVAKHHIIAREQERSHEQALYRWLVLLHRFRRLTAAQYPNSESYTLMHLQDRITGIQSLRQEDRHAPLPSWTADDDEYFVYRDLSPAKRCPRYPVARPFCHSCDNLLLRRRAKYYLGVYEPVLDSLRSLLLARDFAGMEKVTGAASVR